MSQTAYRTHHATEVTEALVGQKVTLAGWVDRRRDHGGVAFIDLRDSTGLVQVVIYDEDMARPLRSEFVIQITGEVRLRPDGNENTHLATGKIEVVAETIEILAKSDALPFQVSTALENESENKLPGEDVRLKYRYLDLRRPSMQYNLKLRSDMAKAARHALEDMDFTEVETPTFIKSTPEGARDFVVPARLVPGSWYALPQSPQLLKQLLMVSGVERYYQLARCYRDEDFRADRQPEFTQLDMEMAYVDQEDVMAMTEKVIAAIWKSAGYEVQLPLPRITWKDAMDKYGSDKPDLRIDLIVTDATEALGACGFGPFEGNTVKAVVVTGFEGTRKQIDKLCADVEVQSGEKAYWFRYDENGEIVGGIAKFVQPVKDAVVAALGLEKGCFVGLTAGKLLAAQKAAGVLRSKLGAFCPNHMDKERYEFCWIVDFPMYEIGEESGLLEFCHNPFSMPNGGLEILKKAAAGEVDPLSITAFQYDLVCNGVELSSGAVRNHDPEIMIEAFQLVRLGEDDVKAKFPAMYNAFTYGAPPHAGIAPGVDRMVMLLAGEDSIREIIPFPMNKNAQDLMMGAPSFVTQAQLDELNIVCTKKEEDEAAE